MKDNLTYIAVVLDRSGSMDVVRQATISGFNEFINGQKQQPGDAHVLLVQFNSVDPHEVVIDKPLAEVPDLTNETFVPRECTPLHDAMGWTICEVGRRLEAMPEDERPGKVVFVTITDGLNNASREYDRDAIAGMVEHQREKYSWTFVFLGANQDAVLTAAGFNIPRGLSMRYFSTPDSVSSSYASLNIVTSSVRAGGKAGFSDSDRKDAGQ